MSEPKEISQKLAAIDAADPLEDPPGILPIDLGLSVFPKALFSPLEPLANSSLLVIPIIIPSSAIIFSTTSAL